jgi:hypothetical protein
MADYVPLYLPGNAVNSTTSAAVTGGQVVYVTGSGTVGPTGAAANIPVGVAANDAASGAGVGYYSRGTVHRLTASGTVTAGDVVEAAAAGAVATHTVGTNDSRGWAIALTTATTGNPVEVMEV